MSVRLRSLPLALMAGLAALALSACAGPASPPPTQTDEPGFIVHVRLTEFSVEVDPGVVPAGVPVTFQVINAGLIEHNVILEPVGARDEALVRPDGSAARIDLLQPGAEASLHFTFEPSPDGSPAFFQLGCHLPGHYQAGMVGEVQVGGEAP